jgi:hypothetical protein
MGKIPYQPIPHDHEAFLKKAQKRKGFRKSYVALETKYQLAREKLVVKADPLRGGRCNGNDKLSQE